MIAKTTDSTDGPRMGDRREPNGDPREEHAWARELLGPYVLGALDPEEEQAVERHLAGCAACRNEEHGLRETHERLAGASIAASSASPDLKARILGALPQRRGGQETTSAETARDGRGLLSPARRAVVALLLIPAGLVVAYWVGAFDRPEMTAELASTELAPGAGGELEVRGSGSDMKANLEVWGLPETGNDEYYELWFGKEGGRVSAGTFVVDDRGRGELSALCPEVAGGYQRAGITLEQFPEEPRMDSARVVLRGDLQ
ncbi:MAG: anti-sigma factor [Actinobacteria bacterium]|nr:anti-sigma factor [Actinomycetota bacterium]